MLEHVARSQQASLRQIQSGVTWRLLERVWAWHARAFPAGTWRQKAYETAKRAAARLLAQDGASTEVRMSCEEPRPGARVAGTVRVRGWCVAPSGITTVEVRLDGRLLGRALYGQTRADVGREFPTHEDAEHSGFLLTWESGDDVEGTHELTVIATARDGRQGHTTVPVILDQRLPKTRYRLWAEANEPTSAALEEMARTGRAFTYRPLISVVTPVYGASTAAVREAVESVRTQAYDHWQLCLADDGSEDPAVTALLKEYATVDRRITCTRLETRSGVSAATNAALALAKGEFVGFLDCDDRLAPDALYRIAALLQEQRDADLVYSDEDTLDAAGERCEPFFKPDWSPDLLLSMNYVRHLLVVRARFVEAVGGLRSEFDGSEDFDLVLRITERTDHIHHLSRVLYHCRAAGGSTTRSPDTKPEAQGAAERAVAEHLARNAIAARVEPGLVNGRWRVRYALRDPPRVAIVLPTGGRLELLRPCLESIFARTDYPRHEILLVDNSTSDAVHGYVESLQRREIVYLDQRGRPFNYSALNNHAVRQTDAPLVLFLNDDTTVVDAEWLTAMVEHAERPRVGVVGAKLVFPSGLIQHAGVVMGLWENSGHAFRLLPADSRAYFDFAQVVRNCSAVTAACMMTKRDLFLGLGGFDEVRLAVAFQDVDYCLRVCEAGFSVVYTPHCTLIHHESVTKEDKIGIPREVEYMQTRWAAVIARDPYYSPHLTRTAEDYALRLEEPSPTSASTRR